MWRLLNGKLILGTTGGIYEILQPEEIDKDVATPSLAITTPLLWHGSLEETKETHSIVLQASGKGIINLDAQDLYGRTIGSLVIEVDDTSDDNYFQDVPLSRQYEIVGNIDIKPQYRITTTGGAGLLKL